VSLINLLRILYITLCWFFAVQSFFVIGAVLSLLMSLCYSPEELCGCKIGELIICMQYLMLFISANPSTMASWQYTNDSSSVSCGY